MYEFQKVIDESEHDEIRLSMNDTSVYLIYYILYLTTFVNFIFNKNDHNTITH